MKKSHIIGILILCALVLSIFSNAYSFSYESGKFGVLVVIDEKEAENPALLTKIKTEMKAASQYLWNATDQQHQFGNITIMVPQNWTGSYTNAAVTNEISINGDVFVSSDINGAYASGDKMFINPSYMKGQGRAVIHEWGHTAYRLGDEYCNYEFNAKENQWYQVFKVGDNWCKCTAKVDFETNVLMAAGGIYSVIVRDSNGESASIMWMQWEESVTAFCDETNHNQTVQTHQQRVYNKSCKDTMEGQFEYSKKKKSRSPYVEPTIKVIQSLGRTRVALVLDHSGSMGSGVGSPLELAKGSAQKFAQLSEYNNFMGVAQFDDTHSIVHNLIKINSQNDKDSLIAAIATIVSGNWTSIGGGLQEGINLLNQDVSSGYRNAIVLLTDGQENRAPWIDDVLPTLISKGIAVYVVGMGDVNGEKLMSLANSTGGTYQYISDSTGISQIFNDLSCKIDANKTILLNSPAREIAAGATETITVNIDSSVSGSLTFSIDAADTSKISYILKDPSGKEFTQAYSGFISAAGYKIYQINSSDIKDGQWIILITNNDTAAATVTAGVSAASEFKVTAVVADGTVDYPDPIHIKANAAIAGTPVSGLTSYAIVTTPSGAKYRVDLNDNGVNGDLIPLDGSYEGYFVEFDGNGNYAIAVYFNNSAGGACEGVAFTDPADTINDGSATFPQNKMRSLGENLNRQVNAPTIILSNYDPAVKIPPGRIDSLKVVSTGSNNVNLQWAASGNTAFTGTAASYQLRYSESPITEANFSTAAPATSGIPAPQAPGTIQTASVGNLQTGRQYYFAIAALNSSGTRGQISNVVDAKVGSTTAQTGSGSGGGGCFIATAAYGSYLDPHVMILRNFRDRFLMLSLPGRVMVYTYYAVSPPLANFIAQREDLRRVTRWALTPLIYSLEYPLIALVLILLIIFGAGFRIKKVLQEKA